MHAPRKQSKRLRGMTVDNVTRLRPGLACASAVGLFFFCAVPAFAAQASNSHRKPTHQPGMEGVHSVVLQLSKAMANQDAERLAQLFSRHAEVRIGRRPLTDGPAALFKALEQPPMSETTPFHVVQKSGRIVAPGLAIVYGELVQYGTAIVRRALPLQLVLKQTGSEWRIVSFWLPGPDLLHPTLP